MGQTTVNFADDEELLTLAAKANCIGLFIGFESAAPEGLPELGRKSVMLSQRDIAASVKRIHSHNILVAGSFIMGLDSDRPGVGRSIAEAARGYGVDNMNVLFLTPLPGTSLWTQFHREGRIAMDAFPEDWSYYTLTYPVARYKHLSRSQIVQDMVECNASFYSVGRILIRVGRNLLVGCRPLYSLISNLSSRRNSMRFAQIYAAQWQSDGLGYEFDPLSRLHSDLVDRWESASELLRRALATIKLRVAWLFRQP
jgi:hypothetical protein